MSSQTNPDAMKIQKCLIAVVVLILVSGLSVRAGDDPEVLAKSLLVEFTEAVIAGPETLAPLLAPEYQIMRSNEELVVTTQEDILVVRYMLEIDEKIDGQQIEKRAPRLTVFRNIDGNWKVVSHSNFAVIPEN